MTNSKVSAEPRFMGGDSSIFTVTFSATGAPKAHIVYLPPFTEEMNRCRVAVAQQARRFAAAGYRCTLLDFYGTGESRGSLDEADVQAWEENLAEVIKTLREENDVPVLLWGCRLGALLALHFASRSSERFPACILWQPVTSGKTYLTQYLRQRAAAFVAQGLPGENTKAMREKLLAGDVIEVAGYPLSGKLVASIDGLSVENIRESSIDRIVWMENVADVAMPLSPRITKLSEHLGSCGSEVELVPFVGDPLWQLHERATCPQLIEKTPLDFQ